MSIILAFPLFSIIICFLGTVFCSFSKKKVAYIISLFTCLLVAFLSFIVCYYCYIKDQSFIYTMGHYPPNEEKIRVCNEIRFGPLEGFLACFFAIILFLCILGGKTFYQNDIDEKKQNNYFTMMCLVLVSNLALIYTNDIFTAYVFIEISTLISCGCLMIKDKGTVILSTIRYMIFNLVGSGLFLIGIVTLYSLSGYLSIENIATYLKSLDNLPFSCLVSFSLITIGLSIKAGLFPFHYWMPDAYGNATPTSSSVLSGIVTKSYIILLIKVIFRMFTYEVISTTPLLNILFVLGILGMIIGSINAIHQTSINRMIAFSSAAQIGYIFMGIGLGEESAIIACLFHILTHAITKPLLFISGKKLSQDANGLKKFRNLRGVGRIDYTSGIAFSVGAFSMVGLPLFAGFISKYLFVDVSISLSIPLWMKITAICALIASTVLNAIYFLRTVVTIYLPIEKDNYQKEKYDKSYILSIFMFIALNICLGLGSALFIQILEKGFKLFY